MSQALQILVIEDNPSDALLLQELLEETGVNQFEITNAETLAQGMGMLREKAFDALLLDLSLPDSSGRETIARVREHMPEVPCIVLTGGEDDAMGLEAVRLGVQDYLVKGKSDGRQVARSIRYAIERKRAEMALQQSQRELKKAHEELEKRVQERTAELRQANKALQSEIAQRQRAEEAHSQVLRRLSEAQEIERSRFSRELHDQLGQELTALKLGLQMMEKQGPFAATTQQSIAQLKGLSDSLMRSIHQLAWELRPIALDDFGLEMALPRYAKEWSEQSGVPVDFHSQGVEGQRLPSEIESALYRVTQEALTNVARHAKAHRASLLLERRGGQVSLIIEDDGQGFDVAGAPQKPGPQGHLGLLGMKERVMLAGGTLQIESTAGRGTTVFVRIPLEAKS